jgi:ABC-type iron transport system FetAB ATPase subunit
MLALHARRLVQVLPERREISWLSSMYKLLPLVVRPNLQLPWRVDVFQLLELLACVAILRREQVVGETRIQYLFSHGGPIEE